MNRAIETLLGTTLILSTTLLYQVYFADPWFLVVLSIAALSATALGTALALLQRPLVTTAASLIGFVVLTIATLLAGTTASGFPTTRTFRILTHQVAEAWGNSLSVTLPADARPEVLMLPLAATWFSALGLTLLCHCSRVPLLPLIPALAAYLLALLVTAATHTSQLRVACLFIVAAALLGLTRARTSDRPADLPRTGTFRIGPDAHQVSGPTVSIWARGTSAVAGALLLSVPIVMALGLTLVLPRTAPRFDPRPIDPPPVHIDQTVSPLATLKRSLTTSPPRALFSLRISDPAVDRVRIAALTDYDGSTWTTAGKFLKAGTRLRAAETALQGTPVTISVQITDLPGPFLPTIGAPSGVQIIESTHSEFGYDASTGTLADSGPMLRDVIYRTTGLVPPRAKTLKNVPAVRVADPLPQQPPQQLKDAVVTSSGSDYDRLSRLETLVRSTPYSLDASPGHSYGTLTRLVKDKKAGYAEQHAAAFAVLARAEGFATRVAVGYRLHDPVKGVYVVGTDDVHAWPEVLFPDAGWVMFEPTDPRKHAQKDHDSSPRVDRADPPPPVPVSVPQGNPASGEQNDEPARSDSGGLLRATLLGWIIVLVTMAVGLLTVVVAKALRRQGRRNARTNSARVNGAWLEMLDRLTERGTRPPLSATPLEVAATLADRAPEAALILRDLAPRISEARYGPEDVLPADADRAWRLERRFAQFLDRGRLRPLQRIRAAIDPRPLSKPPQDRALRREFSSSRRQP